MGMCARNIAASVGAMMLGGGNARVCETSALTGAAAASLCCEERVKEWRPRILKMCGMCAMKDAVSVAMLCGGAE